MSCFSAIKGVAYVTAAIRLAAWKKGQVPVPALIVARLGVRRVRPPHGVYFQLLRRLSFALATRGDDDLDDGPIASPAPPKDTSPKDASPNVAAPGGETFDAFYARHRQEILSYLWRMLGDEQSAFDLSQETFLRAWDHYDRIRRYEKPSAWLFRVATNLALKHLRHRSVARAISVPLDDEHGGGEDTAAQIVEGQLARQIVFELRPRPRAVLILHDVHGLSSAEIAKTLSMSRSAVSKMLYRARELFRTRYLGREVQP